MDLTDISRRLLSGMAAIVRDLDDANRLVHLETHWTWPRGLVAVYEQLSPWTKRTMRLSTNAVRIRDMFKRARDPNKFLFDDVPETLGEDITLINEDTLYNIVRNVREGLEELVLCLSFNASSVARYHACRVASAKYLSTIFSGIA